MNDTYKFPYLEARQHLLREPTEWEDDLASTIENAFAKGHWELEELVAALNRSRVRPRQGGTWTPENFQAVMRELGA